MTCWRICIRYKAGIRDQGSGIREQGSGNREQGSGVRMREAGQKSVGQMLPGIAGIPMFLMFITMLNVYAGLRGAFGGGVTKYGVLALCTLLAAGVFGLLRLKKWGWSLVTAGCLLLSAGDFYLFSKLHAVFFLVRGIFVLLFFCSLVRPGARWRGMGRGIQ